MYIYIYIYCIVIRGPQVHQSLTGEFDLYVMAECRNVLPQLNVHLRCVWYCFNESNFREKRKQEMVLVIYKPV